MKILLLSNKSPWPPKDGGSTATFGLIRGLTHCGASVTVAALNTHKHFVPPDTIPSEYASTANYRLVSIDTKIKPHRLLLNLIFSGKPYSIERFESDEFKKALANIYQGNFDIVQIEGLAMTGYLPILRRLTSARIVFRAHNVESLIWKQLSEDEKDPIKKYYFRVLSSRTSVIEKGVVNDFDGLAAMTAADLEWFESSGLSKPSIVCSPGFPWPATEFSEGKNNQLCFIGSLDWIPNINGLKWFIKKVWPIVSDSIPEATFHIAGRNPSVRVETTLTCRNVHFYGEVESSTGFIRDKQIMVVPLFAGSGLRMKILEGMSMGKSIVASPIAAKGIDYSDGKDIFIRSGENEFAECIISLLRNPALRASTAFNALENVRKNYNIFASAEKLIKFYKQLT